jgi:hypothetical protein
VCDSVNVLTNYKWIDIMVNGGKKISWFSAFLLMWRGKAVELGKNHRIKSLWMVFAVLFSITWPIFEYINSQDFAGALPPEAPMIKTTGTFIRYIEHVGLKEVPYILFNAENGMTYRTEHIVAPGVLDDLGQLKPPVKVYAEGFLLKDGKGSFYPLRLATINGVELTSSNQLMERLLIGRNPFHVKKLKIILLIALISWGFSFFYANKLRCIGSRGMDNV